MYIYSQISFIFHSYTSVLDQGWEFCLAQLDFESDVTLMLFPLLICLFPAGEDVYHSGELRHQAIKKSATLWCLQLPWRHGEPQSDRHKWQGPLPMPPTLALRLPSCLHRKQWGQARKVITV